MPLFLKLSIKRIYELRVFILFSFLFSVIFYTVFINNQLTNTYDGLWNGNYYRAGSMEFSTGRWMLPYMDIAHLGMHAEPLSTAMSLLLVTFTVTLIIDMFNVHGLPKYLISIYILSGTVLTCVLSFRYTSISYGLSIFLSVAAVWLINLNLYKSALQILFSIACIFISLGLYQANIACTAVCIIFSFIHKISSKESIKNCLMYVLKAAIIVASGCIIYRLIAVLHMNVLGIEAMAYRGADNLHISNMIINLPHSILKCYQIFFDYIFSNNIIYNIFQRFNLFHLFFLVLMLFITFTFVFRFIVEKEHIRSLLICIAIVLLPIAGSLYMLFAVDAGNITIHMTQGLAIIFPCLFSLIEFNKNYFLRNVFSFILLFLSTFVTCGNAYQSNVDIEAMYQGKNASHLLMNRIIDKLSDSNLLSQENKYIFAGKPSDNDMFFNVTDVYYCANPYARYGDIWTGQTESWSYVSLLREIGTTLNLADNVIYEQIINSAEVENMPEFPAEGSIQELFGYIVIKVGD